MGDEVSAQPASVQPVPTCSCGSACPTHGIITLDDRMAAWSAGYQRGTIDGRLGQLDNALDVEALREAADLLQWVRTRTLALATGSNWAVEVAGPKPGARR